MIKKVAMSQGFRLCFSDENGIYGKGTEKATNEILRKLKKKENGIAGVKLVNALYEAILDKIVYL